MRLSYAAFSSQLTEWSGRVKRWRCGLSAADRTRLPDVDEAQAAAGHAAEMLPRLDQSDGPAQARGLDGVDVIHAGTAEKNGAIVTNGGRVLAVVGRGPNLTVARERALSTRKKRSNTRS